MNKISAIIKSQSESRFNQRRQRIIEDALNKHKDKKNFQDILNMFVKNN